MEYFKEIPDYKTYAGSEDDFHFAYNANSGGGQSFLGGRYKDGKGILVPQNTLNGRIARFCFESRLNNSEIRQVYLNSPEGEYEIKPRAEGDTNMKLSVGNKPSPSAVIAAFLMLPETCGVKRSSNVNLSALCRNNFWLQSMWLSVDVSEPNYAIFIPRDCIFAGGADSQGQGSVRYFAVDFSTRIENVIAIADSKIPDAKIGEFVKLFASFYKGEKPFNYRIASAAIKDAMLYLAMTYPERYSGLLDPLTTIADISGMRFVQKAQTASDWEIAHSNILAAIRTKPFILLAGISGTGKSRMVRQLARGCCPEWKDETKTQKHPLYNEQKPGNFEMIQVRPNWHDSTQLMGYVSRISENNKPQYVLTDFVRFLAKAWLFPDVPFFLCLDEMNLAPVEQYFAEYLSVVETRSKSGTSIVTDVLVRFPPEVCEAAADDLFKPFWSDAWKDKIDAETVKAAKAALLADGGLRIPQNFIVMGTVNMDETTFSFSRKVLDRAMSFELNEVDMDGGLAANPDCLFGSIGAAAAKGEFTQGFEVYAIAKDDCDKIKGFLADVNKVLDKTPFKIAYRTRNEIMIYCHERIKDGVPLAKALDEATSMKILSRVEGDKRRLVVRDADLAEYNGKPLLESLLDVILKGLKTVRGGDADYTESAVCSRKLTEMSGQLENGYTSFWTR